MIIASNRKALHEYFIENKIETGIVLMGWEVKAIRSGHVQLKDSYVKIKDGEVWLLGCNVTPLINASSHITPEASRIKKLLLSRKEIDRLVGKVDQKGYTLIVLNLHFKNGIIKTELAIAKGKQLHDKRASERERELKREKDIALKQYRRI